MDDSRLQAAHANTQRWWHHPATWVSAGVAALVAGIVVLVAGPSFADSAADEVGLHYGGGVIEDVRYKGMISPGTTNTMVGPGDTVYHYPRGQQTYLVSDADEAQAAPIVVVTEDGVRLEISGRLYFTLNTTEDVVRQFHETIGLSNGAYVDRGTQGWTAALDTYVLPQLDRALDVSMLQYEWLEIRSDPSIRPRFEANVGAQVHQLVQSSTGGDYFCGPGHTEGSECGELVFVVTRLKPMNADLSTFTEDQEKLDAEIANERAKLEAEIADERARLEAQREQQDIENQRVEAELESIRMQVEVLGVEGYIAKIQNDALRDAVASGDARVFVVPQGTPVEIPAAGQE